MIITEKITSSPKGGRPHCNPNAPSKRQTYVARFIQLTMPCAATTIAPIRIWEEY